MIGHAPRGSKARVEYRIVRRHDFSSRMSEVRRMQVASSIEPQPYFTRCAYCLVDGLERLAEETHPSTGAFVCSDWRDLHGPGLPHSVIVAAAKPLALMISMAARRIASRFLRDFWLCARGLMSSAGVRGSPALDNDRSSARRA